MFLNVIAKPIKTSAGATCYTKSLKQYVKSTAFVYQDADELIKSSISTKGSVDRIQKKGIISMGIHTDIVNLESILTNSDIPEYSPEELASMEEQLLKLKHIEDLWSEFSDVPINPRLEIIEQPWHRFPAGTHKETIWHWFENEFHISVVEDLIYDDESDNLEKYSSAYYAVELFNKKTGAFIRQIDIFSEYDDAVIHETRYKDIYRLNHDEDTRICKICYNHNGEYVGAEIIPTISPH